MRFRGAPPFDLRVEMLPGHGVSWEVSRGVDRVRELVGVCRAERTWDIPV